MSDGKDGTAKQLFGVQLELTQKLLAAEDRKLQAMNAELGSGDVSLLGLRRLANKRLRVQHHQLDKEYKDAVAGLLKHHTFTRVRSLPSMGMRGVQKSRSSIFTSMGVEKPQGTTTDTTEINATTTAIGMPKPDAEVVTFSAGRVQSGSLDALIAEFTPSKQHMPEKQFIFTFLATSRLFIPPHALLSRLAESATKALSSEQEEEEAIMGFGDIDVDASNANGDGEVEDNLASKFAKLLREWTEKFSYDFRDERMMVPLREMTKVCGLYNEDVKAIVLDIQRVLFKKLNALEQYESKLKRELELQIKTRNETISAGKSRPDKTLFDFTQSAKEVAAQLKIIEFERLSSIGPEEFIQTFVRGDAKEDYSDMREAHNVEAYVEWFNRLTYIFATEIMHSESKKKMAKVLEFVIMVGHYSIQMANFNTVMAIVSALNFASISRLKKVWAKVNAKVLTHYEKMEWLLNPSGNFKNYRQKLGSLMMQKEVCAIPIFSLMVKDIYFTEEVTKKKLKNGDINFEVMWTFGDRLAEFLVLKSASGPEGRNDDVIRYLKTVPVLSEYELFKLSVDCEPPDKKSRDRTFSRLKRLESSSSVMTTPATPTTPTSLSTSTSTSTPTASTSSTTTTTTTTTMHKGNSDSTDGGARDGVASTHDNPSMMTSTASLPY